MSRNLNTILFLTLTFISFTLLILNYKHSSKIKHLNKMIEKYKEISLIINGKNDENKKIDNSDLFYKYDELMSRDFYRYKCENRKRIGGYSHYIQAVPHDLYRVEGNILNPFKDY